jgi:multicomponent K+:H+ antiporter subunit C
MTPLLLASGIGVLTATGVWLLLRARTFDVPLGLTLLSYAVNLFIFAMGRVAIGAPPILRPGTEPTLAAYADPLPQALVLTAIVISFAMTGVLLALALKIQFIDGNDRCDAEPADPSTVGAADDVAATADAAGERRA